MEESPLWTTYWMKKSMQKIVQPLAQLGNDVLKNTFRRFFRGELILNVSESLAELAKL